MRYGTRTVNAGPHVIDFLTMYPDARRQIVRLLGEIDATGSSKGTDT